MDNSDHLATPGTDAIEAVIDEQWSAIGAAGTWMTGEERIDLVRISRGDIVSAGLDEATTEAGGLVAHRAASITGDIVDGLEARGLSRERYVEVVGVVSRTVAIDTYDRGLARSPRALPAPRAGAPSGLRADGARRRAGWVPTVGAIGPPTALDAVPSEATAQEVLHSVLYLAYGEMADLHVERGLTRPQMELVAGRVSYLNHCRF